MSITDPLKKPTSTAETKAEQKSKKADTGASSKKQVDEHKSTKSEEPIFQTANRKAESRHDADNTGNSKSQQETDVKDTKNAFLEKFSSRKDNIKIDNCDTNQSAQANNGESDESCFTSSLKAAEQLGWSENDTKDALDELEKAMVQACSNSKTDGLFRDMPEIHDIMLVSNSDHTTKLNGNTATVTVRGKDGFSDVQIVTPFDTERLQSCMEIVGTSGANNGLQFVQKGTNGIYNDQCLGMSAIYGAMLKGESAYLQQNGSDWQQINDTKLCWNNNVLSGTINSCSDMDNYSKVTFGGKG